MLRWDSTPADSFRKTESGCFPQKLRSSSLQFQKAGGSTTPQILQSRLPRALLPKHLAVGYRRAFSRITVVSDANKPNSQHSPSRRPTRTLHLFRAHQLTQVVQGKYMLCRLLWGWWDSWMSKGGLEHPKYLASAIYTTNTQDGICPKTTSLCSAIRGRDKKPADHSRIVSGP